MDREKVILGLECCTNAVKDIMELKDPICTPCPYSKEYKFCCCDDLKMDALALLKEQEAVEPKKTAYQRVDHTIAYRYRCGMCDMSIFPSYKYCPFCGQAVKWE